MHQTIEVGRLLLRSHHIDVALAYLQYCPYKQSFGINLVETRGNHCIANLDLFAVHNIVEMADAISPTLEHALNATFFEHGANSAGAISNDQHLCRMIEDRNNLANHAFWSD